MNSMPEWPHDSQDGKFGMWCCSLQIVFCEQYWIGTKEQNPEEHPLPMPSTLQQVPCGEIPAAPFAGTWME